MAIKADKTYLGMGTNFSLTPVTKVGPLNFCLDDIKEENIVRIVSEDVNGDYEISAKLIGQKTWTPIFVGTGTLDTTIDIALYDSLRISTLTPITEGSLVLSAFLVPGATTMSPNGGDASAVNQVSGNAILANILNEIQQNPELECAETPTIINIDIAAMGAIYDTLLPAGTKKFLIRHRNQGQIEFAFENTLTSYISVPKGNSYKDKDLCLNNQIIYFRSNKVGSVEIIAWT